MAYESLKNSIDAYIRQNGVQAITGDLLNGVLNAMVTALGHGYQYLGVAASSTAAPSGDGAYFFLASAGSYPSFGDITVPDGSIGIIRGTGGSWSLETVVTGDPKKIAALEQKVGSADFSSTFYLKGAADLTAAVVLLDGYVRQALTAFGPIEQDFEQIQQDFGQMQQDSAAATSAATSAAASASGAASSATSAAQSATSAASAASSAASAAQTATQNAQSATQSANDAAGSATAAAQAANEAAAGIDGKIATKQDKEDSSLLTQDKSITGAINEIFNEIGDIGTILDDINGEEA